MVLWTDVVGDQRRKQTDGESKKIPVIDLLSDTKTREVMLTKQYLKQVFDSSFRDKIRFVHFDFHGYCKGDKYKYLKVLMGKLATDFKDFEYFIEDVDGRKV